jgi:hypothetical protein
VGERGVIDRFAAELLNRLNAAANQVFSAVKAFVLERKGREEVVKKEFHGWVKDKPHPKIYWKMLEGIQVLSFHFFFFFFFLLFLSLLTVQNRVGKVELIHRC